MKRSLLLLAFVALAGAAALLPTRTTPPELLSDAGGINWTCSRTALVLTTCAPGFRLASAN